MQKVYKRNFQTLKKVKVSEETRKIVSTNTKMFKDSFKNTLYHTKKGNRIKSESPSNGQKVLENSYQVTAESNHRIGISNGEFAVLDQTTPILYHGHVRAWKELTPKMKAVLLKTGLVTSKGKIK